MIVLVAGQENTVWVQVDNAVNVSGFQATLAACGTLKTIANLSARNPYFSFTASESLPKYNGEYGELRVTDSDGNLYIKWLPEFKVVSKDAAKAAIGKQKIVLTIGTTYESSYGGDSDTPAPTTSGVTQEQLDAILEAALD